MVLLSYLLPSRFGLHWGLTQAECVSLLGVAPKHQAEAYAIFDLLLHGEPREIALRFDETGSLCRIKLDLYTSRDFWDEYLPEEMEAVEQEYHQRYLALVEEHIALLGAPTFSGSWGEEAYPDDETAGKITLWDHPEARLQLEFEQPDKEFPFVVRLVSYPRPRG